MYAALTDSLAQKQKCPSIKLPKNLKAKGVVWDLENTWLETIEKKWTLWDENPIEREVIAYPQIITVAWHWIDDYDRKGNPRVYCVGQDDFPSYKPGVNDDTEIVKFLWQILDTCDYEVAHHGDGHDVPMANYRMIKLKLPKPTPYIQVDTKKLYNIAKFPSKKLKDLSKEMGGEQKDDPGGFKTWKGCVAGDPKAWRHMKKYNKQDVVALLDRYLEIRPWAKSPPPLNVMLGSPHTCPACGKGKMIKGMKYHSTKTGSYQYLRCNNCQYNGRERLAEKTEERVMYV